MALLVAPVNLQTLKRHGFVALGSQIRLQLPDGRSYYGTLMETTISQFHLERRVQIEHNNMLWTTPTEWINGLGIKSSRVKVYVGQYRYQDLRARCWEMLKKKRNEALILIQI